jgi:hypothetical protein
VTRAPLILLILLAAGCEVDTSTLEPLDDYTEWYRLDNTGKVPGHGDTYRVIYVNDAARGYAHAGEYEVDSVIVKEVRANDDDTPGDLSYVAIMRKLAPADGPAEGPAADFDLDDGWLFTIADEVGATEREGVSCWSDCHVAAPYAGAWLDYGR